MKDVIVPDDYSFEVKTTNHIKKEKLDRFIFLLEHAEGKLLAKPYDLRNGEFVVSYVFPTIEQHNEFQRLLLNQHSDPVIAELKPAYRLDNLYGLLFWKK